MVENTYNFDGYRIQEVFYEFYTSGKTGVIKVFFPLNIVKTVYFSEGNIVFATSNSEKDKLTNILIKNNKITKEQLNMALKQMDKSISLGRNLVNMGLITHKELVWAVKIQVLSIIYSILMLKEGEYSIIEGFLPEGIIKLPFNTMKILFDSLLLFKDKDWISKQISPDMVFRKTSIFEEYRDKVLPDSIYQKIYDLIDGQRSVGEITGMVDVEDFKVYKLFYALKFLKLIEESIQGQSELGLTRELLTEEQEDMFQIEGDDTENIKMVEELTGVEEKEEEKDVAIEFEGKISEQSVFEEDFEQKAESKVEEDEKEMSSIVLDESDFEEDEERVEGLSEKETVFQDKSEYLEKLQRELESESSISEDLENDDFKVEFDEVSEDEKTIPVASPYETSRGKVNKEKTLFNKELGLENDSFVVEEEYVQEKGTRFGKYVILILILFICAIAYLGYDYYMESSGKSKKGYLKPKESVKVVTKSKDITSEEISDEKINNIEQKLDENTNVPKKESIEEQQMPAQVNKESKKIENKLAGSEKKQNTIEAEVSYEAVPVYENEGKNNNNENEVKNERVNRGDYTKFITNSQVSLITNPESYTIQLELACQKETLDKAVELLRDKNSIFFIPTKFRGMNCFIICYGIYNTFDEAKVAMDSLDEEFFKENTPLIRKASKFKRYF